MKKLVLALSTGILAATLYSAPTLAGGYSQITIGVGGSPHYRADYSRPRYRHPRRDQRRGYHRNFGYRAYYNRHGYRYEQQHNNRNHRRLVTTVAVNQPHHIGFNDHHGHATRVIQYDYHS